MKLATILKMTVIIALMLAVMPAISLAENITATGTVTDANGDPVSGAKVSLIDDSYNIIAAAVTDANGNFQFLNGPMQGSGLVKALVTYVHEGRNYSTRPENVNWIDASQGIVSLPLNDTRLYEYPLSDHGYVWGTVMDSMANGRPLDAMIYLDGNNLHRSVNTGVTGVTGAFEIEVPPGEYVIYALHDDGNYQLSSNRTKITVQPSRSMLDSAPINLIADHRPVSPLSDIKAVPFALALALGILMIIAGWALLNRR